MPAFTLGGTVSGGGNQINNVVIGNSSPLAGSFTQAKITSSITNNYASVMQFGTDGTNGQTYVNGPNASTYGTYSVVLTRSDGSSQVTPVSVTSTGLAVTGALSATGTLSGGTSGTGYSFSGSAPAGSLTLDASGNLGLKFTPSATGSNARAIQLTNYGTLSGNGNLGFMSMAANAYESADNSWNRVNATTAARYQISYTGEHSWYYAGSGIVGSAITFTQAMTLDSSGNLGIGTSSPLVKLDVRSGATATTALLDTTAATAYSASSFFAGANLQLRSGANATGNGAGIRFSSSNNGVLEGLFAYVQNASTYGDFVWQGYNGSYGERMRLDSSGTFRVKGAGTAGSTDAFQVSGSAPASAALLDSSGKLLLTCTSTPSSTVSGLQLIGTGGGNISSSGSSTSTYNHWIFKNGNDTVGSISTNGSVTTYATSSDYRLKDNIAPMSGALVKVAALKPVTYKWKADGSDGEGFIAHELAEVVPQCVTGEKDAVNEDGSIKSQGIDTSFLVAILTAAMQEQQALITQLTARITALETA